METVIIYKIETLFPLRGSVKAVLVLVDEAGNKMRPRHWFVCLLACILVFCCSFVLWVACSFCFVKVYKTILRVSCIGVNNIFIFNLCLCHFKKVNVTLFLALFYIFYFILYIY